ncbi:hypothetical protein [Xenorhabdus bovienii]|uniref:hypothetical protein n=1 Tax=Xenorhabdus bovienii TaxID=40576 RepID=UPI0012D2A871|nr:hypothetical protein [Xenorhabdus bovienii]
MTLRFKFLDQPISVGYGVEVSVHIFTEEKVGTDTSNNPYRQHCPANHPPKVALKPVITPLEIVFKLPPISSKRGSFF